MTERTLIGRTDLHAQRAITVTRITAWALEHWIGLVLLVYGIVVFAPFFAPVFMHLGLVGPAQVIYFIYSFLCHQMAQRSFFMFGTQPMYTIAQLPLPLTGNAATDILALRAFIGNAELGWKVAWSDRMVSLYGGVWLTVLLFGWVRRRTVKKLGLVSTLLLLIPMAVDGGTHFLSDLSGGLTSGFRYDNQWLANLTQNALPVWFYIGDAFGSFNSWMRLISGLAFGFAVTWLALPIVDQALRETAQALREKLTHSTAEA